MISIVETLESFVKNSVLIVKAFRLGKSDVRTGHNVNPAGIDANPIKGMKAVYIQSEITGRPIIVGYINPSLASVGETRLFSTDADGEVQNYVWLKNDGKIDFGGSTDFLVRFSKLKEVADELKTDINSLKTVFSTWVPVANDGGAALKAAAATWYGTTLAKNIDDSKIAELRIP